MNELKQLPGWSRERLPSELVSRNLLVGAELGVQRGAYSQQLLAAGVQALLLVDPWERAEADLVHALKLVAAFPFRTHITVGPTQVANDRVRPESLDFIFISSLYRAAQVRADLFAWYGKVKSGGVIAGDAFLDAAESPRPEFGVAADVRGFCLVAGVTELYVAEDDSYPNWHFFKP